MGLIPDEAVQQVRDRVDIVELVGRYVSLKRSGVNNFGLCPFHSEKSPSFNVNSARQIFHCFGCGEGGNAITFLMKVEGLGFKDAVKRLAGEVGVEIEEERLSPEQEAARRRNEKLRHVNELACTFYQRLLLEDPAGGPARRYLRRRGYDGDAARAFQVGYAPDSWEALAGHLREAGVDDELARQLGLVREGKQGRGDYDLFRGRLIFPIFDHYGQVVAFGGRLLAGDGPKYINSPESPIYHKSRVLYGLYRAKEAMRRLDMAIVVEGYFDVLAMHRAGFTQSVASCGTALTPEHARLLKRYAKKLVLLFDQDQAGQKAALRAMDVALPEGLEVQIVNLAAGEDPDSYLAGEGPQAFEKCLAKSQPALEWYMAQLLVEGEGVSAQARAVDEILQRIGWLPGEIERSLYLKQLAGRTGLGEDLLQRKLTQRRSAHPVAVSSRMAPPPPEEPPCSGAQPAAGSSDGRMNGGESRQGPSAAEQMLLQLMLVNRDFLTRGLQLCEREPLLHRDARALIRVLSGFSGDDPAELLDKADLDDQQKALLSGILKRDPASLGEDPEKSLEDCVAWLHKAWRRKRSKELDAEIRAAESADDQELLAALKREKLEINKGK